MELDIVKLKEITDALHDINFFAEELCEYTFGTIAKEFRSNYKGTETYVVHNGATKGVFVFPNLHYVIKIPFTHSCEDEELYGADAQNNNWDYCEAEVLKYNQATDNGVNECFAKTSCIYTTACGYPIYLQEQAEIFNEDFSRTQRYSEDEKNSMRERCYSGGYSCFNSTWLNDVFNFYGEEKFYKLLSFIEDADIRDLHDGNIGYIGMRPVLVDYSSYND